MYKYSRYNNSDEKVRKCELVMLCILFAVLFSLAAASPPRTNKRYRTDYEYNPKTDAFYKLHIETAWNYDAKIACRKEGAELMTPTSADDVLQLHIMLKQFPDIGNYVYVGIDGLEHESAEETPVINLVDLDKQEENWLGSIRGNQCEVLTRDGIRETDHCYNRLPFICKVDARKVTYDPLCKVYSPGYKYYKNIGSCYKVSVDATTWNQAYQQCHAVGAHLLVLNSAAEQLQVHKIIQTAPRAHTSSASWFIFVGIRAKQPADGSPIVFKTVFNQTLEEAGYNGWCPGEPNNSAGKEYCASIFVTDGKYNDVDCSSQLGYMCETEVGTLN